jgi:oxygen-independent coproporphyrinogen-3 oxidase
MGDYAGVGPGAHGRRTGAATTRHRKPENWMRAIGRNGHGLVEERELTAQERAVEALLMGLRLREGIDLREISERTALPICAFLEEAAVARLERQGLLRQDQARLTVTSEGLLLLDSILAEIVRT